MLRPCRGADGDDAPRAVEVLEVVEHEERPSVGERFVARADRVGDRPLDEAGVAKRCELDEEDAVGELVDEAGGGGQREARLPLRRRR